MFLRKAISAMTMSSQTLLLGAQRSPRKFTGHSNQVMLLGSWAFCASSRSNQTQAKPGPPTKSMVEILKQNQTDSDIFIQDQAFGGTFGAIILHDPQKVCMRLKTRKYKHRLQEQVLGDRVCKAFQESPPSFATFGAGSDGFNRILIGFCSLGLPLAIPQPSTGPQALIISRVLNRSLAGLWPDCMESGCKLPDPLCGRPRLAGRLSGHITRAGM